jgi:DNA invertase Pin-like site-specific DNA recombinase/cob(I)alamin adenosyltransferase
MTKRVACLYRVSTKIQLSNDDIPMQKKACANFIKKQGCWKLEKEYIEKGVSGYHRSANERDALIQLKKDAAEGEFDVLLVFMFDRLGRREDETPFIVEWLVAQNIEVWSVNEGQQRFDDHADKLINYVRYWQSSGESEHTSMRVAEKHNQLVKEGKFRGGVAPFGYALEYSGEYNKKGCERKKLVIFETEATIVKKIFELSCSIDMGSFKVAKLLNEKGIVTRTGKSWTVPAIIRLLKNPVYKGDYVTGKVRAKRGKKISTPKESWVHSKEPVKELMIVDKAVWDKANANISLRDTKINAVPHDKTDFLLSSVAYCGYCKSKLYPRVNPIKRQLKGTGGIAVYKSKYYCCPKKLRLGSCNGQYQYGIKRIEAIVLDEIYSYLENIKAMNISLSAKTQKIKLLKMQSEIIKPIEQKITSLKKEAARLEEEILKCLTGESAFTDKQLSETMRDKANALSALEQERDSIKTKTATFINRMNELISFNKSVVSWKKEFARSDAKTQKELVCKVIDRVEISRESADIIFKYSLYDIDITYGGINIWHGGAPPACPIGSACCNEMTPMGIRDNEMGGFCGNPLGAVCVIPTCAIAAFAHHAI